MNKKLLTYFLLLFLAVAMPSCSNDNDEPESSVKDSIVGMWKAEYDEGTYTILKLQNDGTYSLIEQELPGYDPYQEFGTYLIRKSSLYPNKYILTLIDDKQSIEQVLAFQIVSISKNKLVLRFEGYFEGDDPDDETNEFTRVE